MGSAYLCRLGYFSDEPPRKLLTAPLPALLSALPFRDGAYDLVISRVAFAVYAYSNSGTGGGSRPCSEWTSVVCSAPRVHAVLEIKHCICKKNGVSGVRRGEQPVVPLFRFTDTLSAESGEDRIGTDLRRNDSLFEVVRV